MALLHIRSDDFTLIDTATVLYDPVLRDPGAMPTAKLIEWVQGYPGEHHLLYEDFHVRNDGAEKDTTALRVIGSIEQMLYDRMFYQIVHAQEPVEAKHMVPDSVLEDLGLHMGHQYAMRHVRDALRHGVTYLTDRRYLPVCRIAYPRGGGKLRIPRPPGSRP